MESRYDVFISYRRDGGADVARTLKAELKHKYKVFLDYDELGQIGTFSNRILEAISESRVFLFLYTRGCLDRCCNADDWVSKEIRHAIKCSCIIIPLNIELAFTEYGFPATMPEDIREGLGQHQFIDILKGQHYQNSIDLLLKNLEVVFEKKIPHEERGAIIHIETDLDCKVLRYGKELCVLKTGEDKVIRLLKGKHKMQYVSLENAADTYEEIFEVEDNEMEDYLQIKLKSLKQEREYEERRKAEENCRTEEAKGVYTANGVSFTMIKVEGGTFQMGATSEQESDAYSNESPVHSVTLSDYYIGETEVTQELWQAVMGSNPSYLKGSNLPVEQVSWDDCDKFIKKLNQITGKNFKLPTEAQWEYAARGGNKSKGYKYSGSNNIDDVAWYYGNSGYKTHSVKTKSPNELGIYDMSGNVREWCSDLYGSYSSSSQTNPQGSSSGSDRVCRGGSWNNIARNCRVSNRYDYSPGYSIFNLGFRLVLAQ